MILSSEEVRKLIQEKKMVSGFIELDKQLQQSGIDLTLEKVYELDGKGVIDFENKERGFPSTKEMEFNENDLIHLKKGCYKVRFNEAVKIPAEIAAIARSRSSLLRMGCAVETALWDPGFEGKSESLLIVSNEKGIELKRNARIIQLIFFKLSSEAGKLYEGIHKNIE